LLDPNYLFESFQGYNYILFFFQNMFSTTNVSFTALDAGMSSSISLLDNAHWKAAVTQFNDHFTQAEKEAGSALRPRLISASSGDPSAVWFD
jgi:hypothetical protein